MDSDVKCASGGVHRPDPSRMSIFWERVSVGRIRREFVCRVPTYAQVNSDIGGPAWLKQAAYNALTGQTSDALRAVPSIATRVFNRGESANSLRLPIYVGRKARFQAKRDYRTQAVADNVVAELTGVRGHSLYAQ